MFVLLLIADDTVYPCVYREHRTIECIDVFTHGLSLCIQGTLICAQPQPPNRRFIPVYTGNTEIAPPPSVQLPVYPCVYREHPSGVQKCQHDHGLSLCIQGTQSRS